MAEDMQPRVLPYHGITKLRTTAVEGLVWRAVKDLNWRPVRDKNLKPGRHQLPMFHSGLCRRLEGEKVLPSRSTTKKKASQPPIRSANQQAEALRRFKRDYSDVYNLLRRKLSSLHDQPRPKAYDWHKAYVRDIPPQKTRRPEYGTVLSWLGFGLPTKLGTTPLSVVDRTTPAAPFEQRHKNERGVGGFRRWTQAGAHRRMICQTPVSAVPAERLNKPRRLPPDWNR